MYKTRSVNSLRDNNVLLAVLGLLPALLYMLAVLCLLPALLYMLF